MTEEMAASVLRIIGLTALLVVTCFGVYQAILIVGLMSSVGDFAMEESRKVLRSNLLAIAVTWIIAAGFTAAAGPLARYVTAKR